MDWYSDSSSVATSERTLAFDFFKSSFEPTSLMISAMALTFLFVTAFLASATVFYRLASMPSSLASSSFVTIFSNSVSYLPIVFFVWMVSYG